MHLPRFQEAELMGKVALPSKGVVSSRVLTLQNLVRLGVTMVPLENRFQKLLGMTHGMYHVRSKSYDSTNGRKNTHFLTGEIGVGALGVPPRILNTRVGSPDFLHTML